MQTLMRVFFMFFPAIFLLLCLPAHCFAATSEFTAKVEELADRLTSSTTGEIVAVEGAIVYINLGAKDSVTEGSIFEVVRPGEVVMVNGKPFTKEKPIGEVQITRARKDMSFAKPAIVYAQIQKGDRVYQKRKRVTRIALTEFLYHDNPNLLTRNIYESLSVFFAQKGLQVIERSQLNQVLEEQKISHSGIIDISTAQKLGQLLGAEAVLLGTANDLGNNVIIRARLVDVSKGVTITAAQTEIAKSVEILAMLEDLKPQQKVKPARPLQPGGTAAQLSPPPPAKGNSKETQSYFENDFIRIEVLSFTRQPEGLLLKLKYVNRIRKPFRMIIERNGHEKTYLVDDSGNQYPVKEGEMLRWGEMEFPPGVPRISSLVFRDQKGGGDEFIFSAKYEAWDVEPRHFFASIKGLRLR